MAKIEYDLKAKQKLLERDRQTDRQTDRQRATQRGGGERHQRSLTELFNSEFGDLIDWAVVKN